MAAIRAKWHSRHGATMMMALLMLLVATVVSVVVITSATTAMRRVNSDHAQQQAWLTVSSAAQMLRDGIEGDSYAQVVTKVTPRLGSPTTTESQAPATGDFSALLNEAMDYLRTNIAQDHYETTFTVSAGELDPVTVHFFLFRKMVDGDEVSEYGIRAFLYLPEGEQDCRMTLKIGGTVEPKTTTTTTGRWSSRQETTVSTTTITWNTGSITKGAAE